MSNLELQPISYKEACIFVDTYHRHHKAPQGHKFSIAVNDDGVIAGVVMVGRPVARHLDNGWTLEVTRLCTIAGHKNAASMLYGAAWRATRAMGYKRLVTYILKEEIGTSLVAAGYKEIGVTKGGSWNCRGRPRIDKHPTGQKKLFEVSGI